MGYPSNVHNLFGIYMLSDEKRNLVSMKFEFEHIGDYEIYVTHQIQIYIDANLA